MTFTHATMQGIIETYQEHQRQVPGNGYGVDPLFHNVQEQGT